VHPVAATAIGDNILNEKAKIDTSIPTWGIARISPCGPPLVIVVSAPHATMFNDFKSRLDFILLLSWLVGGAILLMGLLSVIALCSDIFRCRAQADDPFFDEEDLEKEGHADDEESQGSKKKKKVKTCYSAAAAVRNARRFAMVVFAIMATLWVAWVLMMDGFTEGAASSMLIEQSNRTAATIQAKLDVPLLVASLTASAYELGQFPLDTANVSSRRLLDRYLVELSCLYPELPYIYVGIESTGDLIGAYGCNTVAARDSSTGNVYYEYGVSAAGERDTSQVKANYGPYDCRQRPWYNYGRDHAASQGGRYGEFYGWSGTGTLGMPFVVPIRRPDGSYVGIIAVDILSKFLNEGVAKQLAIGEGGRFFVVDGNANLVGVSHDGGQMIKLNDRSALTAGDSKIQAASKAIVTKKGTFRKAWGASSHAVGAMGNTVERVSGIGNLPTDTSDGEQRVHHAPHATLRNGNDSL